MIYLELFLTFFKISAFTFGGGYAMLPFIQEEVLAHGWIDLEFLIDFVAIAESTPGPLAVNLATYIGSEMGGFLGAVCATLGLAMPPFIIILIVAKCFEKFKKSTVVSGCMTGLRPAVVSMIASAVLSVALTVFFPSGLSFSVFTTAGFYVSLVISGLATVFAFRKMHPILIICICAVLGIVAGYTLPIF